MSLRTKQAERTGAGWRGASFKSAEANTYKLARPLFIYSDAKILKDKPQVAAFVNFYLSYVDEEIQTVGYFGER